MPKFAALAIMGIPAGVHAFVAQATTPSAPMPEWLGKVTEISAFGLVAWIVYFMFTKWLPALQLTHSTELEAQRKAHTEATKTLADAHAAAVMSLAKAFAESLQYQRTDLLALIDSMRENTAREKANQPPRLGNG